MMAALLSVALLAAALGSGRAFVSVVGLPSLRRLTPLNAAGSAVLGLATVTVLFAWLTAAGMSAPVIAIVLLLLHAVAIGLRPEALSRPRGPRRHWVALAIALGAADLFALLPALHSGSYAVDNDTHTYCAFGEWLQIHGFGTPCPWDPESPVTYFPNLWQQLRATLGASYPLALAQAAFGSSSCLLVYPAVSAAGLALGAGGVAGLARRALRLPPRVCFFAALLYGVLPGPAQWAHHNGFLQQTLALPVLVLGVGWLARPAALLREGRRGVVLVALLASYLLLVYLPFVPLLAAAALPAAWRAIRKSRRAWLGLAAIALLTCGFSLGAPLRAAPQLGSMTQAVPGSHVTLTPREVGAFALGAHVMTFPWSPGPGQASRRALTLAAPGLLLLALLGLPRLRTALPSTGIVLGVLSGAAAYYSLVARDPWTGLTGHTWSLFKLLQWWFPFVVALQAGGLASLERPRHVRWPLAPLAALLILALLPAHWTWSDELGSSFRRLFPAPRPIDALAPLQRRLRELPGGPLLVLNRPGDDDAWLGVYAALLAWPRPIVADWEGSVDVRVEAGAAPFHERMRQLGDQPGPVPILLGTPFWDRDGLVDLGPGVARAIDLRPRVVKVRNPDSLREDDGPPLVLGPRRTKVSIFAAHDCDAELEVDLRGEPPASIVIAVLPPRFARQSWRAGLKAVPEARVSGRGFRLPLRLEAGLTRIALRTEAARETNVIDAVRLLVR
jgi:hypothetical protein